jgi:hypothetical protein
MSEICPKCGTENCPTETHSRAWEPGTWEARALLEVACAIRLLSRILNGKRFTEDE